MIIVLATGIYPPQIGGPATYVQHVAEQFVAAGHTVTVVTYGEAEESDMWQVERVTARLPLLRWFAYAATLRRVAQDADVLIAFSSISCGVPLVLSGIRKPKKILRLGGDFFWERYTDWGGTKSLRAFYDTGALFSKWLMALVLRQFDHLVFSTQWQQALYQTHYRKLPATSVIQNALPVAVDPLAPVHHEAHSPLRLLFMGRFVRFKNISALLQALPQVPECTLTLIGTGPLDDALRTQVEQLDLHIRVQFVGPVHGEDKQEMFAMHDALILPSLTEISPNTALEARAYGVPVVLSAETGLSAELTHGMMLLPLHTTDDIAKAISQVITEYDVIAETASKPIAERSWSAVAADWLALLS